MGRRLVGRGGVIVESGCTCGRKTRFVALALWSQGDLAWVLSSVWSRAVDIMQMVL